MDILCPQCAEPWENDCLHDEADDRGTTYTEVMREFQTRGCETFVSYGAKCSTRDGGMRAAAAGAIYELLGDDMDGAASLLEDFEWAGMLDG